MILATAAVPPIAKNGYVIGCEESREGVLIDPGDEVDQLLDAVRRHALSIRYILLTHAHFDHVTGVGRAKQALGVPVGLHRDDEFLYRAVVQQGAAFGLPVGLSDHTRGIAVAAAAAALGAELVEKHFTLSRELEGPDHPFALEPGELKAMIEGIREAEAALGSGRLEGPSEAESGEMYKLARRSVIAATDIPAGTVITEEMLTVKRPGYGIKPKDIAILIGRTARVDIEFDDVITWEMV